MEAYNLKYCYVILLKKNVLECLHVVINLCLVLNVARSFLYIIKYFFFVFCTIVVRESML